MSTAHNTANKGDFAKTVIMPGDPLRAKYIAETFLDDARLVNNVRGIQGYTGTYHGKPVLVMASGMGMPSMGIYSYELFNFYDVDNIIRVGSAGGIAPSLKLRDVVIGAGACTNSNFAHQFGLPGAFAPIASFSLLEKRWPPRESWAKSLWWAILFPPILFMRISRALNCGRKWAFWQLKWRLPRSI